MRSMSRFQRNDAIQVLQTFNVIKWRNMFFWIVRHRNSDFKTHLWFICIVMEYICYSYFTFASRNRVALIHIYILPYYGHLTWKYITQSLKRCQMFLLSINNDLRVHVVAAQWIRGRVSDLRLRWSGFESCVALLQFTRLCEWVP